MFAAVAKVAVGNSGWLSPSVTFVLFNLEMPFDVRHEKRGKEKIEKMIDKKIENRNMKIKA